MTTEYRVEWDVQTAFDAASRAALAHDKSLVYVCPPAPWMLRPLFEAFPGSDPPTTLDTLLLTADYGTTIDAARAAAGPHRYSHPLTGFGRTERLVRANAVHTLAASPTEALYLAGRATLRPDTLTRVVLLWPETFEETAREAAEQLLADAREQPRIVVTADPTAAADWIDRYARRAPTAGPGAPSDPETLRGRYAVVDPDHRLARARDALDTLDARTAVVWDPWDDPQWRALAAAPDVTPAPGEGRVDLAIATDLPTPEGLRALGASAATVLVMLRAPQLPYVRRVAPEFRPLRLAGEVDRVRDASFRRRSAIRERIERGDLDAALHTIDPLLHEFDPAVVAAAALAVRSPTDSGSGRQAWSRLFVTAGRREGVRPEDIVGVFARCAGLQPHEMGRIELRDNYTLIDVMPEVAERAMRDVSGEEIRGRRVTVRRDRQAAARRPPRPRGGS